MSGKRYVKDRGKALDRRDMATASQNAPFASRGFPFSTLRDFVFVREGFRSSTLAYTFASDSEVLAMINKSLSESAVLREQLQHA